MTSDRAKRESRAVAPKRCAFSFASEYNDYFCKIYAEPNSMASLIGSFWALESDHYLHNSYLIDFGS